ncbi:MAG: lysozyme inhibitor LprI family protein [Gammaproteobacteria bacterium]
MMNNFRAKQRAALIAIGLILTGCYPNKEPPVLAPASWQPSLEQVREFIAGMPEHPASLDQLSLSTISQNLADIRDAQLYIAYIRLLLLLDDTERRALAREQQNWLLEREKAARKAVVSKGGSLAPLEYNEVFIRMTEARLSELEKRWGTDNRNR